MLNHEQAHEEQMLTRYEPMLRAIVNDFQRRCSYSITDKQDLMQEARIAFLCFIRDHNGADMPRCYLTIIHALYDAVRRDYPLSISYGAFSKNKRDQLCVVSFDELKEMNQVEGSQMDISITIQTFFENLTVEEQIIVSCKLDGQTNREIAKQVGLSDATMTRRLRHIRDKWEE